MTELSREILRDWQVRKTKEQKSRFIAFLQERLPALRIEEGGLPRCRNLILGDIESADVVFTAHYDTCARLPFPNFITPKNLLIRATKCFQPVTVKRQMLAEVKRATEAFSVKPTLLALLQEE